jgi:hypothetical protein
MQVKSGKAMEKMDVCMKTLVEMEVTADADDRRCRSLLLQRSLPRLWNVACQANENTRDNERSSPASEWRKPAMVACSARPQNRPIRRLRGAFRPCRRKRRREV